MVKSLAVLYLFRDESSQTIFQLKEKAPLLTNTKRLGVTLQSLVEQGLMTAQKIANDNGSVPQMVNLYTITTEGAAKTVQKEMFDAWTNHQNSLERKLNEKEANQPKEIKAIGTESPKAEFLPVQSKKSLAIIDGIAEIVERNETLESELRFVRDHLNNLLGE